MTHAQHAPVANTWAVAQKLDAAGWGVFFLWIGIALLANVGWGVGLLGVGIIMLGGQFARTRSGLASQGFWVIVSLLFLLGGVWELLGVQFSLVPVVLVVAGAALLLSAFRKVHA